jgi:hypothetical protein
VLAAPLNRYGWPQADSAVLFSRYRAWLLFRRHVHVIGTDEPT